MLVSLFCKPFLEKEKQRCRLPLLASWPLITLFLVFGRCKGRLVYKKTKNISQINHCLPENEHKSPTFETLGLQNKLIWFII